MKELVGMGYVKNGVVSNGGEVLGCVGFWVVLRGFNFWRNL